MEDPYIETHKTWEKIEQKYEDKFMEFGLYSDTYKQFCDILSKQDASIFEIGCGPGNITRHLLSIKPSLKILATDISKNMVALTKKNNPNAETQVLDCRSLDTIPHKFDGIVCGFTIPYLSQNDCKILIADCADLLNEEGVLYLSFVSGNYDKSGFISGSSGDRTYFYYHELETIKQELQLNHLITVDFIQKEYIKSETFSETHTILNLRKL